MKKVLITGGTGVVGQRLSELLSLRNYEVSILTRSLSNKNKYKQYLWDISNDYIDPEAILNTDYILHLAGANIADKRWTNDRKKIIIDSRVKSADLLFRNVQKYNSKLNAFITSSGVGYYGAVTNEKVYKESDPPGSDFAAQVCVKWEDTAKQFQAINIRTAMIRTAVVISANAGVVKKLQPIFNWGIGSPMGSGKQFFPWIHLDDLCGIFIHAMENKNVYGPYNAVSAEHHDNASFSKAFSQVLSKPFWAPNVPSFVLKYIMGESSEILLNGSKISNKKIIDSGFHFTYQTLDDALMQACL